MKVIAPFPSIRVRNLPAYELRDPFLSPFESRLQQMLEMLSQNRCKVICKAKLSDLFRSVDGSLAAFNKISQKHVDFLICSDPDWIPMLAIEVDDWSHETKKAKKTDMFKNNLFASTGLPLMRVQVEELDRLELLVAKLNYCWNHRLKFLTN